MTAESNKDTDDLTIIIGFCIFVVIYVGFKLLI